MIEINWNPISNLGAIPINWYGVNFAVAFLFAWWLVLRWAPKFGLRRENAEGLLLWILAGTVVGARLYFIIQNDPVSYFREPWRVLAVWEGGLAFFGGLFGGTLGGFLYSRRENLSFPKVADLFAPAIPIGGAIGRISCGLAGMDYGTPTSLPWGVTWSNPDSYAPNDGIPRHPTQFYELIGDLMIAALLWRMRHKTPTGGLFLLYLMLFGSMRFFLFFLRGDVPPVALGLKNGHWTALAILAVAVPWFLLRYRKTRRSRYGMTE